MKKRSKEILDLLGRRENDHTISTLAAKFEVSERTIRNDICLLYTSDAADEL